MYKIKDHNISNLVLWIIVLNCFSYPITAVIIAYFQVPSGLINIGLKIIYSILALVLIYIVTIKDGIKIPYTLIGGLCFFFIYSVRLIYDIGVEKVPVLFYSDTYILSYFFGATLLPIIAITFGYRYINVNKLTLFVFWALVIANFFLIYYLLVLSDFGDLEKQLARRAHIKTEGTSIGTLINPITIGYYGATLSLFCINAILSDFFSSKTIKWMLYPLIAMGFIILLLGASRGPLLGFVLILFISLMAHFYRSTEKVLKIGKFIMYFAFGFLFLSGAINEIYKKYDIFLFYRVEKFFTDRDKGRKEVRDFSFESAWNDFLSSPFVGKQFVGTYDNFYPHNIFLEVLMATGIFGGVFFLIYFFKFSTSSIRLITKQRFKLYTPLVFTSFICFFLSVTSGSIFSSPEIWIMMTLTTLLTKI